jgi:PAS domain S-box-containing protein
MPVGNLTGRKVGRFRLVELLGKGSAGSVYRGAPESGGGQEVAIKVLDPALLSRPGFVERFEKDIRTVAGIRHPHLLRLYEYGSSSGVTGLAMELARGGTLREEVARGPVALGRTIQLAEAIAGALEAAHEAGLVHGDVKPTNILFDDRRQPKIADFGLAKTHFTYALGTPGYMAPELALDQRVDRRCDVYSLAVVAFEMLAGSQPYGEEEGPNRIVATVMAPVPKLTRWRPDLPTEVDEVFQRALAKSPDARHPTTGAFAEDLHRALRGAAPPPRPMRAAPPPVAVSQAPPRSPPAGRNGHQNREAGPDAELQLRQTEESLLQVFETALLSTVIIDERGFIIGWNPRSEALFGWAKDEILGRSLGTTLVPPRYREAFDRGFGRWIETGEGPVLGKVLELEAMHKDGHLFPAELSICPATRVGPRALVVGYVRDISREKNAERMRTAQAEIREVLQSAGSLEAALPRVFHSLGTRLDWSTGAYWVPLADRLVCRHFWKAEDFPGRDFETATLDAEFRRGVGLAGRVWATGDPIWVPDVLEDPAMTRALPALRAGLHCAVLIPVLEVGEVRGVLELFANEVRQEDEELLMRLFDIGRRLARLKPATRGTKIAATLSEG